MEKKQRTYIRGNSFLQSCRLLLLTIACYCIFLNLSAQSTVNVTVTNADTGEALIGVNIYTEDFKFSSATDIDGKAELINLAYRQEVIFSYIGFSELKIPLYAIRRQRGLIQLYPDATVDTIVVIGRTDALEEEIPYEIDRIKKSDISFSNAQTSADALANSSGVFVQKTQAGGGSPVIRGFEANRVLLVLDGVRMNNAIYRNGHHQNAVTVDNAILEQMEVIYGPGSLTYGSDALGGVVHFRSKDPKLMLNENENNHRLSGNFYTRFASANLEKRAHLDLNYGKRKWGFLTSLTLTDYDALRAGNKRPDEYPDFGKRPFYPIIDGNGTDIVINNTDPNVQVGMGGETSAIFDPNTNRLDAVFRVWETEYNQIDFLQKVKIQPNKKINLILNYQVSTTSNVPRYDNLLDTLNEARLLKFAEWYYGPQFRTLASAKLSLKTNNPAFDKATIIGAFQRIDEDRFSRKPRDILRRVNKENVFVYSLTADFSKHLGFTGLFTYGIDIGRNRVDSKAYNLNINNRTIIPNVDTRYPSNGATMATNGAYTNYRWRNEEETLIFNMGARYSSVNLYAEYLESDRISWPDNFYTGINADNSDFTWATSFIWNSPSKFQLRLMAAKAFRAPNIDDWAKNRTKGNKVLVPNVNLQPERAINYELTVAKEFGDYNQLTETGKSIKLSSTFFMSNLKDAIVRVDSSTLNVETLIVDEVVYDIQTNINANTASIRGISGNLQVNINNNWLFNSSINFTKGTALFSNEFVQDTIVPFAHIPPTYGTTGLTYQNGKIKLELNLRYNARKKLDQYSISDIEADGTVDREGTADNLELTPTTLNDNGRKEHVGAYGWKTFNFYSSYKLSPKTSINFSVENTIDLHYRPFASTISAPGRNFVFALHSNF